MTRDARSPTSPGCPTNAVEHALMALGAAHVGDAAAARDHIGCARGESPATTRRQRQIVEIATLVVAGNARRATGLALVHTAEFPEDAGLLELVGRATTDGRPREPSSGIATRRRPLPSV